MQPAVLALSTLAADPVVLALDMVVTEGAGVDMHSIPAGGAILQGHQLDVRAYASGFRQGTRVQMHCKTYTSSMLYVNFNAMVFTTLCFLRMLS